MKFTQGSVQGSFTIEPSTYGDDRGFFSPIFEDRLYAEVGISERFTRVNTSYSAQAGTVRGMHFQPQPHQEGKLLRVIKGSVWDVALDLREDSPTFGQWHGVQLSAKNRTLFYIPPGCAHGFQTLEDHSEVLYLCSNYYQPQLEKGVRWNDPAFGIDWPLAATVMSDKDQQHTLFNHTK